MKRIITIGREFGSGGRELGKRLAELLQVAYYDNEIVTEIARKTEFAEAYVSQVMETNPMSYFPITIGRTFNPVASPMLDQNNTIYAEQTNIITEMAQKSDCVIVGRCGDYILRNLEPFRIFVYAEMEFKLRRCRAKGTESEQLSDKELKNKILSVDKRRQKYYEFYTGQKWGDRLNYDLCVNTTHLPIKDLASSIAKIIG